MTTCRHPLAKKRGIELSNELGIFLTDVKQYTDAESFALGFASRFGAQPPADMYSILSQLHQDTIEGTILHLLELQSYDPSVPQTDALLATDDVAAAIEQMDCRLLKAPVGNNFVLGDRPFPASNLSSGFTIPLSKRLALEAKPRTGATVLKASAVATLAEITASNEKQVSMARELVIGPDQAALKLLSY